MGEHSENKAVGGDAAETTQVQAPLSSASASQQANNQPGNQPPSNQPGNTGDEERKPKRSIDWKAIKDQVVGLLAGIARWVGLIFAVILVLHIVFVVGEANVDNSIVSWVGSTADGLTLGFQDLFTPDDPKLSVLINYGIAAIFWLVVSAIIAKVIRRVGGSSV